MSTFEEFKDADGTRDTDGPGSARFNADIAWGHYQSDPGHWDRYAAHLAEDWGSPVGSVRAVHAMLYRNGPWWVTPEPDVTTDPRFINRVAFDLLADYRDSHHWPIDGIEYDHPAYPDAAEAFEDALAPAYTAAARDLGYEAVFTNGGSPESDDIRRGWDDDTEYTDVWQEIHDTIPYTAINRALAAARCAITE